MLGLEKARRPAGEPGGAGALFGAGGTTPNASSECSPIIAQAARGVKLLAEQAARLEAHHRELAAWHRERAARWLEWAHLGPWYAAHWREHVDAAAWNDRLAAHHAELEGVRHGDA